MKNYSKWKDEEVKQLFKFVEQQKSLGKTLTNIFYLYAQKTGRKANSVRNYYYIELANLTENIQRRTRLNIDIKNHTKMEQKEFCEYETKELVTKILELKNKGYSVRKACLFLAKNDVTKMLRYQNKFRNVVKNNSSLLNKCLQNVCKTNSLNSEKTNNIIKMPDRRNILTDSDINSLFLGLIKLVKKQEKEELCLMYEKDKKQANSLLRKALIDIAKKDSEIKNLQNNFKLLEDKHKKLNEEVKSLRGKNLELKIKQGKLENLKSFTQKYKTNIQKNINN